MPSALLAIAEILAICLLVGYAYYRPHLRSVLGAGDDADDANATAETDDQWHIDRQTDENHILCPHCGTENLETFRLCRNCTHTLPVR